jgi:hypothetical protein
MTGKSSHPTTEELAALPEEEFLGLDRDCGDEAVSMFYKPRAR